MWTCPYCGKDWTHAEVPEMAVCCGEMHVSKEEVMCDRRKQDYIAIGWLVFGFIILAICITA